VQVLKKDYVAAGLCCIQLFLNSSNHEQALRHLEHAKVLAFDDLLKMGSKLVLKFWQLSFLISIYAPLTNSQSLVMVILLNLVLLWSTNSVLPLAGAF
jgi:hypothetical protein